MVVGRLGMTRRRSLYRANSHIMYRAGLDRTETISEGGPSALIGRSRDQALRPLAREQGHPKRASRQRWLSDDDALLADCRVETYRASGPGGQKRNKTSSAVRLTHRPTGLNAIAEESRSQHQNRARALRRIRLVLALNLREPVGPRWQPPIVIRECRNPAGQIAISTRNRRYAEFVAAILDAVVSRQGRLRDSAALLGIGSAQLSRFLTSDKHVLARVNDIRRESELGPLVRQ